MKNSRLLSDRVRLVLLLIVMLYFIASSLLKNTDYLPAYFFDGGDHALSILLWLNVLLSALDCMFHLSSGKPVNPPVDPIDRKILWSVVTVLIIFLFASVFFSGLAPITDVLIVMICSVFSLIIIWDIARWFKKGSSL